MENLHDLPTSMTLGTPSLWFWVKAGLGFGAGFMVAVAAFYLTMFVGSVGMLVGMARALSHR